MYNATLDSGLLDHTMHALVSEWRLAIPYLAAEDETLMASKAIRNNLDEIHDKNPHIPNFENLTLYVQVPENTKSAVKAALKKAQNSR